MNVALLGSGEEWDAAADSVVQAGHRLTHAGPVRDEDSLGDRRRIAAIGAAPVRDHHDALAQGATTILMVSYAPLIEPEALARGTFLNVHFALLPRFRGYHGLVWSIINGDTEVGFTLHAVDARIDHGPIHHQCTLPLGASDTIVDARANITRALREELGAALTRIESGSQPRLQDDRAATIAARRTPMDGRVEWSWSASRIFNLVRALTPPVCPGAFTSWRGRPLILRRATPLVNPPFIGTPGRVVDFVDESAWVMCGDRLLQIDEIEYDGEVTTPRAVFTRVGARLGAT